MHNVGSAFRTADAMGIRGLLLSGYTPCPPRAELSKTALGAEETVSWFFKNDPEECVHMLKEQGYDLVSLEQTVVSIPIHEFVIPSSKKICLLLGNEITGVDESLIIQSQHVVEIPQYGNKHSLNVSVAAGIALFAFHELYRCR
ncbi:MAG: TrmH family RNA methyltransferase [Bacteroidetes bacterium]|nr:TrmH family RNA methyltransferase [Bacteroidota bacterium]